MPTRDWTHLCNHSLIDITGKISIIGIFDSINAPRAPVIHPQMHVVTSWTGRAGEKFTHQVKITPGEGIETEKPIIAISPPIKVLFRQVLIPDGSSRISRAYTAVPFAGIRFPAFGEYFIEVHADNELIHSIPFTVRKIIPRKKQPKIHNN